MTIGSIANNEAGLSVRTKLNAAIAAINGLAEIVDVDGDGTTDHTAAIQAKIDAASAAGGGVVFVPEGTFVVSVLTLKPEVQIVGAGPRATIIKAKTGVTGTDFGLLQMATGEVDWSAIRNLSLEGSGNAGQWGMYLYADKGAGATGGLFQSDFDDLLITNFDNGIWLRGGRTGAVEPHQFLNFRNVTVLRTAAGAGDSLRCTGQVNQVTRTNCLWQSASAATTRTGRSMYFGRDPNELANASGRYPQAHTGNIDSIQGADWLVDIESGANLIFNTPYCEKAKNVFRVRSVNISNPTDVQVNCPRFAAVATTTEVPTTGGSIVDLGDYCDFRIKGPGYMNGVIPTPYVIQNDSDTGSAQAINLQVEGFATSNTSTTQYDVPFPRRYLSNTGTASTIICGAWKHLRLRGRGAGGGIELATINSLHAIGESFSFVCYLAALDMNNTGNLLLPGGVAAYSFAVGDIGRATKIRDNSGVAKWRIEKLS